METVGLPLLVCDTLNARGEFVGLAFDGTLDGVISDWAYAADEHSHKSIVRVAVKRRPVSSV